ncbi:MAG TPA: sigma 54-interacting transcriptional regulator, partial [Polyangiaceae bacterium]
VDEPLALGDTLALGAAVITLQSRATTARPRRVWAHGYFEARVEEECARADRNGQPFAVLRVRALGEHRTEAMANVLGEGLRPSDIVAVYAPLEFEVLLVDTEEGEATAIVRRVEGRFHREGVSAEVGVALFKRDGRTPEALIARAGAALTSDGESSTAMATAPVRVGAMQRLQPLIERIASGVINVLLVGETGVGKEVMARSVHELSPRAKRRLLAINCAALPEALLESELFGHERGAFTGAVQAKVGLLEAAEGGTVFLDEAGEMPLPLQAKLLRVLDQREVFRVGSVTPRPIDVRFLAATNRDLVAEVERGRFRQDLYFRLNGVMVAIPPLRERVEEILPLAQSFLSKACRQAGRAREPRLAPEAVTLLEGYAWPGNIRELKNVVERAVLLCAGDEIRLEHLPGDKMVPLLPPRAASPTAAPHAAEADPGFPEERPTEARVLPAPVASKPRAEPSERERVRAALEECAGNQTHAAKLLGVSRGTLIARIKEYEIPRPRSVRRP